MKLSSNSFQHNTKINIQYTCDGDNISPHLKWSETPEETESFVLISEDPDAPIGTFTHWILFNIPSNITEIEENLSDKPEINGIGTQGKNDFGKIGYGGPCPPSGIHRYFFKLYALDCIIDMRPGLTRKELDKAIKGHKIAEAELMGIYERIKVTF